MLVGRYRANSTATMAEMVQRGLGIGYMAELIMRSGIASGGIVELLSGMCDTEKYPIYAVYQVDRLRLPRVKVLLEFLGEVFSPELDELSPGQP